MSGALCQAQQAQCQCCRGASRSPTLIRTPRIADPVHPASTAPGDEHLHGLARCCLLLRVASVALIARDVLATHAELCVVVVAAGAVGGDGMRHHAGAI